jgi:hypothetical protein
MKRPKANVTSAEKRRGLRRSFRVEEGERMCRDTTVVLIDQQTNAETTVPCSLQRYS